MSWFGNIGALPGAAIGTVAAPGVGTLGGYLIGAKNDTNNGIDQEIANNNASGFGPGTPGYIDPSKTPAYASGIDARTGGQSSPWLGFENQKIASQVAGAQDQAAGQAGAAASTGLSEVAGHGGVTSGSAERAITNANNQGFNASAEAARGGITASANAGAQDQQLQLQKAGLWGQLAEEDANRQSQAQISNAQLAGSMYGANQTANAALQASKKQGLLGLGIGPL